jgi:hypothetical protein
MPRVKKDTTTIKPDGGIDRTLETDGPSPDEKASNLREKLGGIQPSAEEKATRGRPKGSHKKKEAEPDPELKAKADAIARVLLMGMKILVKRLPNPDPITPDEEGIFTEGVSPVIEKYLPAEWAPEVAAIFAVGMILGPRFVKEKKQADVRSIFDARKTQDAADAQKAQEAKFTDIA